jgi:hypothetical protein
MNVRYDSHPARGDAGGTDAYSMCARAAAILAIQAGPPQLPGAAIARQARVIPRARRPAEVEVRLAEPVPPNASAY